MTTMMAMPMTLEEIKNPLNSSVLYSNRPEDIPNIIDFVCHDGFLNRPNLYPRQGTLLKIIFLQDDLLTSYDHEVINEWEHAYLSTADDKGEGNNGIIPGVRERIKINKTCSCGHLRDFHEFNFNKCSECPCARYTGKHWFREVISVIGRRGSKGHVGGICGAYILWHYITKGDPQNYYGVDRDKRLTGIVFAGKKEQAKANQWKDLNNYILGATCFAPYISRAQTESLTIYSRHDFAKDQLMKMRGVKTDIDPATFEIIPKESTTMAGRGPASFFQMYDEAAHVIKGVAKAPAEDVYECLDPQTRVLMADLTWRAIDEVQIGDQVVAVDEVASTRPGTPRKLREATVTGRGEKIKPSFRVTFSDGSSVVCSGQHRWLRTLGDSNSKWASIERPDGLALSRWAQLKVGQYVRSVCEPWEQEIMYDVGYLAANARNLGQGRAFRSGAKIVSIEPGNEMRMVDIETSERSFIAEGLVSHNSSTPSLDQFGLDGFIYIPSSPWQKIGLLYDKYQQAREVDEDGTALYPEMLMIQLTSWDIYVDWERANEIERTPGGLPYQPLKNAVQTYDYQMQQLEKANPDTFAVERRSRFASVMDAYLNPERVKAIWEPYDGREMTQQVKGKLSTTYRAHGDPSQSNAGFGFAMGHIEAFDDRGLPHVVFDMIRGWDPADFEGHQIDYDQIRQEIATEVLDPFMPSELTFDQFNSVALIQALQRHARAMRYPKQVQIYERTATGPLNWKTYETFKTALGLGLVHGPYHELAELELTFLQDLGGKVEKPTSGPVKTKDISDCFHPSMEVLTEHGWMPIKDVPQGIKVATRSPEGRLEYQEPTDYIARHYTGPMYEYDSLRINFSVTPKHRMMVQREGGVEFIHAEDLTASQYRIPRTAIVEDRAPNVISFDTEDLTASRRRVQGRGGIRTGWTEDEDEYLRQHYATASMVDLCSVLGKTRGAIYNRARPNNLDLVRGQIGDRIGDRPKPLPETKVEDFAAFLGIWLAEGRKMRDRPGYDVKISQTKPDGVEWIDQMFSRLPWPVVRSTQSNGETVWTVKSHGLREYLRACQGEDHELLIPDEVFSTWTHREMEQLLEGLLVGDGVWSSRYSRHIAYVGTSKRLVDDVQRLLAHLGLSGYVRMIRSQGREVTIKGKRTTSNHDLWYVGVESEATSNSTLDTKRLKQVDYDGMVHCLTVPNSTLLVRRNGVATWSGNCLAIVVYELIGEQMSAFVGKMLSEVPVGAQVPGGFNPYPQQEEAHQSLSSFGRGRAGMGGPRGRRGR